MLEDNSATRLAYPLVEAGRILGIGRSATYELVGEGKLDARKIFGKTVVTHASLVAFMEAAPKASIHVTRRRKAA